MLLKALMVAGLVVLPAACSDDQEETQEAVGQDGENDGFSDAGMDSGLPGGMDGGQDMPSTPIGSQMPSTMAPDQAQGVVPGQTGFGQTPGSIPVVEGTNSMGKAPVIEGEGQVNDPMMTAGAAGSPLYVRSYVLRVRNCPGMQCATVGYVTFNTEVHALETQNHWVKIGNNKFVGRHFLSPQKNSKQFIPAH